jgi:hypothetical protein
MFSCPSEQKEKEVKMDEETWLKLQQAGLIPKGGNVMDQLEAAKKIEKKLKEAQQALEKGLKPQVQGPPPSSVGDDMNLPVPAKNQQPVGPIIDCSVEIQRPPGFSYLESDQLPSRVTGRIVWNPKDVILEPVKVQHGGTTRGYRVKNSLGNMAVLRSHFLVWLMQDPARRIPRSWRKFCVFFFGDIFRNKDNIQTVQFIHKDGGSWSSGHLSLRGDFYKEDRVAVLRFR